MARNGITQEQVHKAAERLRLDGQPVTVASIRHALGETGSYTTISNHLRSWRQGDTGQPMPKDLERSIISLLGRIWRALTQSGRETERHVRLLESEVRDYEEQVREIESRQSEFQEKIEALQRELTHSELTLRHMEKELGSLKQQGRTGTQ